MNENYLKLLLDLTLRLIHFKRLLLDRRRNLIYIMGPWTRVKLNLWCNSYQVLSYTCSTSNETWGFSCPMLRCVTIRGSKQIFYIWNIHYFFYFFFKTFLMPKMHLCTNWNHHKCQRHPYENYRPPSIVIDLHYHLTNKQTFVLAWTWKQAVVRQRQRYLCAT